MCPVFEAIQKILMNLSELGYKVVIIAIISKFKDIFIFSYFECIPGAGWGKDILKLV